MSTPTINGHDHSKGGPVTQGSPARAHAHQGDLPSGRAEAPESAQNPTRPRAIPRLINFRQAHAARNFLRPHTEELRDSITRGWAMTEELLTPAEMLSRLLPVRSRWYAWPLDLLGNLLALAVIFGLYLVANALGTRRRRRIAVVLVALAITTYVVAKSLST